MAKNIAKQQEDNSEGDICYLENIYGAGQTRRQARETESEKRIRKTQNKPCKV